MLPKRTIYAFKVLRFLGALLAVVAQAGSAQAVLIPVSESRHLYSGGAVTLFDPETNEPIHTASDGAARSATAAPLFDESIGVAVRGLGGFVDGIAIQRSEFGPSAVDVHLRADSNAAGGESSDGGGSSLSAFLLSFDVLSERTWRIRVNVAVGSPASGMFALSGDGETLLDGYEGTVGQYEAVLVPGRRYQLMAMVEATSNVSGGWGFGSQGDLDLHMELIPIPEPASLAALAAGLLVLGAARRSAATRPARAPRQITGR